jgi:hypothetical protein
MLRQRLALAGVVAAVAVLTLPAAATAAPASTTFAVNGFEYAFTSTVGNFAGSATGDEGDRGAWNASVEHDPLGSTPPIHVTGGTFQMGTRSPTGALDFVTGTFVDQGGTITTINPGTNCTNQRYLVTGTLGNVRTSTSAGGTGTFAVTLTHHRVRFFGRCFIYSATVNGTVSFAY